jgi:hypothetical protein
VEKQRTWFARRLRDVGGQAVTKVVPFEDSEEDILDKESREERRMRGEEANSHRGEPEIEEPLVSAGEMELVEDEYMEEREGEFKISEDEIGSVESGEAYDLMMSYWIDIMELELDSEHFSVETVWTYIQAMGKGQERRCGVRGSPKVRQQLEGLSERTSAEGAGHCV